MNNLKKVAAKQEIKGKMMTVGYRMEDENGVCKFYIEDGGCGDTKWNLNEGDSAILGFVDAYPTLKAAVAAARGE